MNDDFLSYLASTDQFDDFFGKKEDDTIKCPGCKHELFIYENYLLYCKNCGKYTQYNLNKKIYNKKLTYTEKQKLDNE